MKLHGPSLQRDIRAIFAVGTFSGLSDGQLLDRFLDRRDEAAELAFSALVERHGPMVLRVCRGVLVDRHDSEDAFQATFLVLARKASTIRNRDSLASFLHGVAIRAARDLRSAAIRRRKHEGLAITRPSDRDDCPEIHHGIHEEVARLPERYRAAIILCELEGLSCEEAAHRLGCAVGTIKSRLSRGRDRLRDRLIRRGVTSGVVFGALAVVPEALAESASRVARPFAAGSAPAAIAERIVRALGTGWLKPAMVSVLAIGAAVAIGVGRGPKTVSVAPLPPRMISSPPRVIPLVPVVLQDDDKDDLPGVFPGPTRDEIVALIKKIGRDAATPELVDQVDSYFRPRATQSRDFDGMARRVADASFVGRMDALARDLTGEPADTRMLIVRALRDPVGWQDEMHRAEMRETLALWAGPTETLRGQVVDEDKRPIAGAVVSGSGSLTRTDADGRFALRFNRPQTPVVMVSFEAKGFGLIKTGFTLNAVNAVNDRVYPLVKQAACDGRVVDPQGKPVAGATLDLRVKPRAIIRDGSIERFADVSGGSVGTILARTDARGRFAFRNLPHDAIDPRQASLIQLAHPKFEPGEVRFRHENDLRPGLEITLQPGCSIAGEVLDEAGMPVVKASVRIVPLKGLDLRPGTTTDAAGRFRFDSLTPGVWRVVVQPERLAMTWAEAATTREAPVDLKMIAPAGAFLAGKVIGPDGKPAANAAVGWLTLLDSEGNKIDQPIQSRITRTTADGTFRLGPIPEGKYRILGLIDPPRSEAYAEGKTGQTDIVIRHAPGAK